MRLLVILIFFALGLLVSRVYSQRVPDTDGDGWSDGYEFHLGTSPASRCMPYQNEGLIDANPADFNQDNNFDIFDVVDVAQWFGYQTRDYSGLIRYDISPEPQGDGVIDIIGDINQVVSRFGSVCN